MTTPFGSTRDLPIFDLDTTAAFDGHPALANLLATTVGSQVWVGGVENAVAPPEAFRVAALVGGVVETPTLSSGDIGILTFTTSGELRTTATFMGTATVVGNKSDGATIADTFTDATYALSFLYAYDGTDFRRLETSTLAATFATTEFGLETIAFEYGFDVVGGVNFVRKQMASLTAALAPATVTFGLVTNSIMRGYDGTDLQTLSADTAGTVAPDTIIGGFPVAVVDAVDPTFTATHAQRFSLTTSGRLRVDTSITSTVTVVGNQSDGSTIANTYTNAVNANSFLYAHDDTAALFRRLEVSLPAATFPVAADYGLQTLAFEYGFDVVGGVNFVRKQMASLTAALAPATVTFGLVTNSINRGYDGTSLLTNGAAADGTVSGLQVGQFGLSFIQPNVPTTAGGFVAGKGVVPRSIVDTGGTKLGTAGSTAGAVIPLSGFNLNYVWDPSLLEWFKLLRDPTTAALAVSVVNTVTVKGDETWVSPFSTAGTDWEKMIASGVFYNGTDLITWMGAAKDAALPSPLNVAVIGGQAVTADETYTANDASPLRFTDIGGVIVENRTHQPDEVDATTTNIAAAGTFTGVTSIGTSFYSDARGRKITKAACYFEGATATITFILEATIGGGATFRTVATFVGVASTVFTASVDVTACRTWRWKVTNTGAGATTTFEFGSANQTLTT